MPQLSLLQAVAGFMGGSEWPIDALLKRYPKVSKAEIVARQRALEQEGLLDGWGLTADGIRRLLELENA